ncbi:DNA-3-methyladenine glycosylase I [Idiomarina tyrosinivorans]|uniref:DNA-3-methyladenine glycosylase I n=1 Tax=Idiomarina tyrosinivorans TaxID=1445662 RepID=UPI0026834D34
MQDIINDQKPRCGWCGHAEDYQHYHDTVWGRPELDPQRLFEKLCLDGQQAGLSWITILRKQENFRQAFYDFDPTKIVAMSDRERQALVTNKGIIRHRGKIDAIFSNAQAYLALEQQGMSFDRFIWQFVDGRPLRHQRQSFTEIPTETETSKAMSKALKKAGFRFVGPTICYAFMQAVGLVNDHLVACHCHQEVDQLMQHTEVQV